MKHILSIVLVVLVITMGVPLTPVVAQSPEGASGASAPLGICYPISASIPTGSASATCDRIAQASGTWQVSGVANGAYLEYYVDGALEQSEPKTGTTGWWWFVDGPYSPGTHTLVVKICPKNGGTICWSNCSSRSFTFTVLAYAPPAAYLDAYKMGGSPVFQFIGAATCGNTPYRAFWKDGNGNWFQDPDDPPGSGPFYEQFNCKPATARYIYFKVMDAAGNESNVTRLWCDGREIE